MSLDSLVSKLDRFEAFAEQFRDTGSTILLGNHQLVPIFDAVENGLRRFLLAYGTGAGKTFIPVEIIKHLQRKRRDKIRTVLRKLKKNPRSSKKNCNKNRVRILI